MVKKSLFVGGVVLSLFTVWTVLSDSDDKKIQIELNGVAKADTLQEEIAIVYAQEEKSSQSLEDNESIAVYVPEKYVETHAFDMQHEYEIALVNPDQKEDDKSEGYVKLNGTIGRSSFTMRVPKKLLTQENSVMLRVKNLKTEVEETTPATFLYQMQDDKKMHTISINPDEIYNFEFKSESVVLP
jgi:hypothetical protein